jgi:hypothetical protein
MILEQNVKTTWLLGLAIGPKYSLYVRVQTVSSLHAVPLRRCKLRSASEVHQKCIRSASEVHPVCTVA